MNSPVLLSQDTNQELLLGWERSWTLCGEQTSKCSCIRCVKVTPCSSQEPAGAAVPVLMAVETPGPGFGVSSGGKPKGGAGRGVRLTSSLGKDWISEQILLAVEERGLEGENIRTQERLGRCCGIGGKFMASWKGTVGRILVWAFEDEAHPGKFLSLWCGSFILLVQEGESPEHYPLRILGGTGGTLCYFCVEVNHQKPAWGYCV